MIYKGKCKFIKKGDCAYSHDVTFDKKNAAKERVKEINKVKNNAELKSSKDIEKIFISLKKNLDQNFMNDENKEYEESDLESDFIEIEHIIELSERYPDTKENKRSSLKNGKEDRDFKSLGY